MEYILFSYANIASSKVYRNNKIFPSHYFFRELLSAAMCAVRVPTGGNVLILISGFVSLRLRPGSPSPALFKLTLPLLGKIGLFSHFIFSLLHKYVLRVYWKPALQPIFVCDLEQDPFANATVAHMIFVVFFVSCYIYFFIFEYSICSVAINVFYSVLYYCRPEHSHVDRFTSSREFLKRVVLGYRGHVVR